MKVDIIHKEPNEECFEVLKSAIIEDKVLDKWTIDKETLIQKLPEHVVNEFLDFIGTDKRHRELILSMIKQGSLVIECSDE